MSDRDWLDMRAFTTRQIVDCTGIRPDRLRELTYIGLAFPFSHKFRRWSLQETKTILVMLDLVQCGMRATSARKVAEKMVDADDYEIHAEFMTMRVRRPDDRIVQMGAG